MLVNLHHHNAGVKKDALSELKDVLVDGAEKGVQMGQREGEIGRVVRGVLGLISNEEASVRKALLQFLGWYLALLQPDTLAPYMHELLLQASMGLSHIYHDIRIDACRLISLLLTLAPTHVVGNWPLNASQSTGTGTAAHDARILDGLRLVAGIGGRAGEGGQNGLNLLPKSKLVILETLLAFVKAGLRKQGFVKGKEGSRTAAPTDLQVPSEIFSPFQPRYPIIDRTSSKGKAPEPIPLARLSDVAFAERGALFDGWFVGAWEGEGTMMETMEGGWDLGSVAQRGEEEGGENVGEALSVSSRIFFDRSKTDREERHCTSTCIHSSSQPSWNQHPSPSPSPRQQQTQQHSS